MNRAPRAGVTKELEAWSLGEYIAGVEYIPYLGTSWR